MELAYFDDDTSSDTTDSGFYFLREPALGITSLVANVFGAVVGTCGNILVIGAVLTHKPLRKVGNAFIVNLAIADLCVTAFVNPFTIVGLVHGKSWFMERYSICMCVSVICFLSCAMSMLNVGAISINRLIHIVYHAHYDKIFTRMKTTLMCVAIWGLGLGLVVPTLVGWGGHRFDEKTETCVFNRIADLSFTVVLIAICCFCPILLTVASYLKIFLFVREQKRKVTCMGSHMKNKASDEKSSRSNRKSIRLAITLFIIFTVFVICWTPYGLVIMIDVHDSFPKELHLFVGPLLSHTNSSINGIIYGLADRNFRLAYMKLLGLTRCKQKRQGKVTDEEGSTAVESLPTKTIVSQGGADMKIGHM